MECVMRGEELEGQDAEGAPAHAEQAGKIPRGFCSRIDREDDRERMEGCGILRHRCEVPGMAERKAAEDRQRSSEDSAADEGGC